MAGIVQIRVSAGENSHMVTLHSNATVDDLFKIISKQCANGIRPEDLGLVFGDEVLKYNNGKTLKDYKIVHLSTVTLLVRLEGGIWPLDAIEAKTRDLVPLPGFITVTTSPSEPDMISFDDSRTNKRAKMPCGHVIGPNSMTSYCQSLLTEGKYKFYCPAVNCMGKGICNREWEYFLVRHVACLTPDEMHEFEKKIADNYLQKASGMQKCPGCQIWCFRAPEVRNNCVRCPLCTKNNGVGFDFCWACENEWRSSTSSGGCGNLDCDGNDKRLRIVATCITKKINSCLECPSIRGCPKCGILIEHKDACGHVNCTNCECAFCFICLKVKKKTDPNFQCLPWDGTCVLAPRQTSLPGCTSYHP